MEEQYDVVIHSSATDEFSLEIYRDGSAFQIVTIQLGVDGGYRKITSHHGHPEYKKYADLPLAMRRVIREFADNIETTLRNLEHIDEGD